MEKLQQQGSLTTMRRKDRAIEDEQWIKDFLAAAADGVLATASDGQPFVHINTFVYDEATHAIYMHTAGQGRLRSTLEANDKVSFCASKMGRLLPADTAREFSVEFDSMVAFGRGSIMTDMKDATEKMQLLMDKYFGHLKPGENYRPITDQEIAEIAVIKISIDDWSAKRKEVAEDFPGAFRFGEQQQSGTIGTG